MNRLTTTADRNLAARHEALEARFGLRVRAQLEHASDHLPHDITERLRVAREVAMSRARAGKTQLAHAAPSAQLGATTINPDGTLSSRGFIGGFGGDETWWVRLSSLVPLLLLVAGLLLIHHWERQEQINAAADIDAALLSDTLPPEAYTDPGFDEFLKSPNSPIAQ